MRVRVLGAFCIGGERQAPGSEIEVADELVYDLVSRGKAEAVAGQPALPSGPLTTESVPSLVQGKARKGAKNVG